MSGLRASIPNLPTLLCGCALVWLLGMPMSRAEAITVGVNVVNPQRLSAPKREAVLDQLQAAGIRVMRVPLAPPWGGSNYAPAIDFVRRAHERGIKSDLIVGLQYRDGAQRRPAAKDMPEMWPSFRLSDADPTKFRAVFEPAFNELEGLGITFAALELGNEINWAAFNGEFPVPGRGRVFGREDLEHDPEVRQIADGYRAYLRTLRVLKDIRDHSRLNRQTPILSAGLSDPGSVGHRPGRRADAVTIAATIQYLRENGLDQLVDAYGIHAYPWAKTSAVRRAQLEQDTFGECRSPAQGKPCWLTEWGLPAAGAGCAGNDAPRTALMREMLDDFRRFASQGRLQARIYYAWADDRYGVFRCGSLTESGMLAVYQ
jgi:hypothetical protein